MHHSRLVGRPRSLHGRWRPAPCSETTTLDESGAEILPGIFEGSLRIHPELRTGGRRPTVNGKGDGDSEASRQVGAGRSLQDVRLQVILDPLDGFSQGQRAIT